MKLARLTLLLFLLLTACTPRPVQSPSSLPNTSTFTPEITLTRAYTRTQVPSATLPSSDTPTVTATKTRTPHPSATAAATRKHTASASSTPALLLTQEAVEATVATFGTICQPPTEDYYATMSPNGHWIAMICRGTDEDRKDVSYLRVFSVQGDKAWSIIHTDYTKELEDNNSGEIYPFHWSADDKYLYAAAHSRMDGCCWIGNDLLLVRLNLATGLQTEIENYISNGSGVPGVGFSISPSDRYILTTTYDDNLHILDTYTWKQRVIELDVVCGSAGEALMSPDDKKVVLMFREFPEECQGDSTYGSIVLIDLESGSQNKLLSGFEYWDTPRPVNWADDDHVLLSDGSDYWLLDIQTAELKETEKP